MLLHWRSLASSLSMVAWAEPVMLDLRAVLPLGYSDAAVLRVRLGLKRGAAPLMLVKPSLASSAA